MKKIYLLTLIFIILFITSCNFRTHNVVLNINDDLSNFITYEEKYEIKHNEEFTFPTLEKNIYVTEKYENIEAKTIYTREINEIYFEGWKDEKNIIIDNSNIKIKSDKVFTPIYSISTNTYSVELVSKGIIFQEQEIKDIYTYDFITIENENYTFGGWYNNELYLGKPVESIQLKNNDSTLTYYAKLIPTLNYVNSLINELPENLTIYDIEKIQTAYDEYQDLSYQNKQLVENYAKLQSAYDEIENLTLAYDIYNQVIELYDQDLRANLKKEFDVILELLETLEENGGVVESLLPDFDYEHFKSLVIKVNDLYQVYIEEAIAFDKRIAKLPINLEQYYEKEINEIYTEYQELDENVKTLLNNSSKLESLYQNLQTLHNQQLIYYMNTSKTNNVYLSKKQLFESFFTDFYYYIAAYHDLEYLKNNKINNVDDFVILAGDFTGAGANNLYGIGNIAGRYMLERDVNGILENQTENGFFGFCYQNNLYQDLLPFFINFFAYWRIDEHYANLNNYGADIFAESWAPTVDIAKFFYYDEVTSYVQTERMIDCLTNTASVVYDFNESNSLPTIRLRGYIFEGWYDNENYQGSKITNLTQTSSNKLYAKWSIDQNQVNEDSANLVDIYIYNLTTTKAVVNNTTIGYVKQMYDNLTKKGKALVKNYSILEELIDKYN